MLRQAPPVEVARVTIPTPNGEFDVRAFQCTSSFVYLAMVRGEIGDGAGVLTRIHSECLTGDALGSLRCDCGPQLQAALRAIAAEGRGVVVYATGHEGRGIGLVNKLRAYMLQDAGDDTLDANAHLGLPIDARDYADAAGVLLQLGVRSVRLLTNNPAKVGSLGEQGVVVDEVVPLATAPHARNLRYLRTKRDRFGHVPPTGPKLNGELAPVIDATSLLGDMATPLWRPRVVVKFAQTLDGRIATASGDSKWISGEDERRVSHALRAACDAVMVGAGTVAADDPHLTVRMVEGRSPIRVIVDSTLRLPLGSNVLDGDAHTIVVTTERSTPARRMAIRTSGAAVAVVRSGPHGVDLADTLRALHAAGIRSVLVEGGAGVITSLLADGLVDRLVVGIAPTVIGAGVEAVGDLRVGSIAEGLRLTNRDVHVAGEDLLIAGDIERAAAEAVDTPPLESS
ncbi:MAG: GTP cyclohydrolase II [Actinomycetota bacterium]